MKTASALLFISIFAYARAQDLENCRKLAINIAKNANDLVPKDPNQEGADRHNQYIDMAHFLAQENTEFAVTRATYDKDFDGEEFKSYCTTLAFGKHCGPIRYKRKLIDIPQKNEDGTYYGKNLAKTFKMELDTWTYNLEDGRPVYAKMTASLVHNENLILQNHKDSIKFYDLLTNKPITDVPRKVIENLSKPFAMNKMIYADKKKTKVAAVISISCDEKYAWATYDIEMVNAYKQGTYGTEIEEALHYLDKDLNGVGRNEYEYQRIQSVSTVFPEKYLHVFVPAA